MNEAASLELERIRYAALRLAARSRFLDAEAKGLLKEISEKIDDERRNNLEKDITEID